MKTRILAAVLAGAMLFGLVACSSSATEESTASSTSSSADSSEEEVEESIYPDYLNMESDTPMVVDGEQITLKIMLNVGTYTTKSDIWFWEYLEQEHNIIIELEEVLDVNAAEQKNLAFSAGTDVDIFMKMSFSTTELVNYGVGEGQILDMNEYISEELTPNLLALMDTTDGLEAALTATDGGIYSTGAVSGKTYSDGAQTGSISDFRYNDAWLQELGMDIPETVDEFLDVLRGYATLGDDIIPFGGSWEWDNGMQVFATAVGVVTRQGVNSFINPTYYNDEASFIYGNQDVYQQILEWYNTMYEEGLISQDFFTLDTSATQALGKTGVFGVLSNTTSEYLGENFTDYLTLEPLVSDLNDTQIWGDSTGYITIGSFVINAETEYPELCVRFMDFFYDAENAVLAQFGPNAISQSDILYDMTQGWTIDEDHVYGYLDVADGTFTGTNNDYKLGYISAAAQFVGYFPSSLEIQSNVQGTFEYEEIALDLTTTNGVRRQGNWDNLVPYVVDPYPTITYFSEEESEIIADNGTVINTFATVEFAKFVTGEREITDEEMALYFEELDALGYQEYLAVYVAYDEEYFQ
ncbi:MAG: hypothetical protein R3Y35_03690 [Clostridia bacterium]